MKKVGPYYIGSKICFDSLRNWILELSLTEADTLLLHPHNFEDIIIEHRVLYGRPMPEPYFLLGVLIDEATSSDLPRDEVLILQDDSRPVRIVIQEALEYATDDGRTIFRCGWCGNVLEKNGELINGDEKSRLIQWIKARGGNSNVKHIDGKCCSNQA